jgi:hypothetical protein
LDNSTKWKERKNMTRSLKNLLAGSFCALLFVGMAHAQISGTIYNVTGDPGSQVGCTGGDGTAASCASQVNGTSATGGSLGTKEATFTIASGNIDLNPSDSAANYTIGTFLASDPAATTCTAIVLGACSATMDDTLWVISGTATVTNGETFTSGHDDGLTLVIGGVTVINAPSSTAFNLTSGTYTGATGPEAFSLVYGECCGAPASLSVNNLGLTTPEPTSVILIPVMLLGVALVSRKRFSRSA